MPYTQRKAISTQPHIHLINRRAACINLCYGVTCGVGSRSTATASVLCSGLFRNDLRYLPRYLEAHSNLCQVRRDLRQVSDHGVDTMVFLLDSSSIRSLGAQSPIEYKRPKCTGLTILPVRRRSQRRSPTISFVWVCRPHRQAPP